jgi:hypothetical protein
VIEMADADAQAKETVAKSNEVKAKQVEQAYHPSTPTPTQEENDLAVVGVHTDEHADDGSGPSPQFEMVNTAHEKHTKQSEAHKPSGGSYQTRAATPARETPKPQQS